MNDDLKILHFTLCIDQIILVMNKNLAHFKESLYSTEVKQIVPNKEVNIEVKFYFTIL